MCDETTDITTTGKLIVFAKVINEKMKPETYFLGDINIENKTANGITEKLLGLFEQYKIDLKKIVALGTDGASTMMGHRNGVSVQLRRKNPYMLQFHCSAHRLALCTEQSASDVSGKFFFNFLM
jgi:hypothetical protein